MPANPHHLILLSLLPNTEKLPCNPEGVDYTEAVPEAGSISESARSVLCKGSCQKVQGISGIQVLDEIPVYGKILVYCDKGVLVKLCHLRFELGDLILGKRHKGNL